MSEWTILTLKQYIDMLISQQDKAVNAALAAQKEAVVKAEAAAEKRFESVNEFRAQLASQQSTFITQAEYETEMRAIRASIESVRVGLQTSVDTRMQGITDKLDDITGRLNRNDGHSTGLKDFWGYIIGAAALGGFIIKILFP